MIQENQAAVKIDVYESHLGEKRVFVPKMRIGKGEPAPSESVKREYSAPQVPNAEKNLGLRWQPWGSNDDLPLQIFLKYLEVPFAIQAFYRAVQMMYGNGIRFADEEAYYNGEYRPAKNLAQILDFNRKNRVNTKYLPTVYFQDKLFANTFSQIDLSVDQKQVTNIYALDAWKCRLAQQNEKSFKIEWMKFSGKFSGGEMPRDEEIKSMPLYRWYEEEKFFEWLRKGTMVWHSCFETPGQTYYATPLHIAMIKNGSWLSIAKNNPAIVSALQENQVSIKYQIVISMRYYELKYKDWQTYTQEQCDAIIDTHCAEIEKSLTGPAAAGKTIMSFASEIHGVKEALIDIRAIDDKLKRDSYIPDDSIALSHLTNAIGMDGSQFTIANMQSGINRGAGSDKMAGYNIGISTNMLDQDRVHEPLEWAYARNGWKCKILVNHQELVQQYVNHAGVQPADKPNPKNA
jgi:hypothetical protein